MARRPRNRRTLRAPARRSTDLALGVIGEGKIDRGPRLETVDVVRMAGPDGTIVVLHRVRDSLLDAMLASGWIGEEQRDDGARLKALWVMAGVNLAGGRGRGIALGFVSGEKAEVDNPRAFSDYQRAVRRVEPGLRAVLVAVCVHDEWREDYRLDGITAALDQLGGFE